MNNRRVEVTFSVAQWDALEKARGHEKRASFCRRAVEAALNVEPRHGPEFMAKMREHWEDPALQERFLREDPVLAPESVQQEAADFLAAEQPQSTEKELRGLKNSAEAMWPDKPKKKSVKDLMWERQQKLNKGKS